MIIAINYADEKFEKSRKFNTKTAYKKGKADKVIEYNFSDLDAKFVSDNAKILSYKRGAGLWLWKPYIILKTLETMSYGDYLFYCDSGAYYVNKIQHLVDVLEKSSQDILVFETAQLECQFTKKETFHLMDFFDYTQNQIHTTCILFKKSEFTIVFVKDWLNYMEDERVSSYKHFCQEIEEFPNFVSHREDQSVLSILCRKKNLKTFRDPSNYGDRPWMYTRPDFDYREPLYEYSPYPKIVVSNRKVSPQKYQIREFIMNALWKIGIFNQKTCFKLHGVTKKPLKR